MTKDVASERKEKLIEILNMPQTQINLASAIATRKIIERLTEIAKSPVETAEKTENAEAKPAEAEPKEAKQ